MSHCPARVTGLFNCSGLEGTGYEHRSFLGSLVVLDVARRIAADGPQVFDHTDDFSQKYGVQAQDMLMNGGLVDALYRFGIEALPARFEGPGFSNPAGVRPRPRTD